MPARKKGAAKASAASAKRAGKQAAASPSREASASDAGMKTEIVEPLVVKVESGKDGISETKPQVDLSQVQPSTASDADAAIVRKDMTVPIKEEAVTISPLSPERQHSTPPDAEEIDSKMNQADDIQKQSELEIKQEPAVTYPESDTEEDSGGNQNVEPMAHIEQGLDEMEMDIADEAEIEMSDAMSAPFSTEKIRHTSPISARVLQNVRALKEEILNGGGNMSGMGRLARFTLNQIDDSPDEEMPNAQTDVMMASVSAHGPNLGNAASSSKVAENTSQNGTSLDPVENDHHSRANFADQQYPSTQSWAPSRGGMKREQLESAEVAHNPHLEDSRVSKRPRNDPPTSDWRDRARDHGRSLGQFGDSYRSRATYVREGDQGGRADRRPEISGRSSQLPQRGVLGSMQRDEHRETTRDGFDSSASERRSFPDPSRPSSFAPPTMQYPRDTKPPPPFPPPVHYSAAAPPPPPAFVPSAQSFGPHNSNSTGPKRHQNSNLPVESGPHSSPYPSRFNAGFDRENESQQLQKRLPNSAPGSTEKRGFQDRMPPSSGARPPVTNRDKDEPGQSNRPPLPSLTAANLGANARHNDAPPRSANRALSKASDDGRSNISEARRYSFALVPVWRYCTADDKFLR